MGGKLFAKVFIDKAFVGSEIALAAGLGHEHFTDGFGGDIGNVFGTNLATSLYEGDNGMLLRGGLVAGVVLVAVGGIEIWNWCKVCYGRWIGSQTGGNIGCPPGLIAA